MEMAGNETGNMPKSYSLNMSKDFVPMSVFSEVNQGQDRTLNLIKLFLLYTKIMVITTL